MDYEYDDDAEENKADDEARYYEDELPINWNQRWASYAEFNNTKVDSWTMKGAWYNVSLMMVVLMLSCMYTCFYNRKLGVTQILSM